MSRFTTQRNFGFGKQMDWAGHQALKDIYGRGHFGTVASHAQRWRQFCRWARSNYGINDACAIDQPCWKLCRRLGRTGRGRNPGSQLCAEPDRLGQHRSGSPAPGQDHPYRVPGKLGRKRQTVRTRVPDGMDWSDIDRLVAACARKISTGQPSSSCYAAVSGYGSARQSSPTYADWQRQARNVGRSISGKAPRAAEARKSHAGCRSANVAGLPFEKLSRSEISWVGRTCSGLTRRLTIWSMMAKSIGRGKSCTNSASRVITNSGRLGLRAL
jgi:hypothetical protein